MIGYVCKYTPVEIFEAFGEKTIKIETDTNHLDKKDSLMHPNMCSYSKIVLEQVMKSNYDGIILTTCCDSIRRLYDVLVDTLSDKFIYILDVPRKDTDIAINSFEASILHMIQSYEKFSGKSFSYINLKSILSNIKHDNQVTLSNLNIGIMGARCNNSLLKLLNDSGTTSLFNLTCNSIKRTFIVDNDDILFSYSKAILSQFPCMRMTDISNRDNYINQYNNNISGIIYHTVKFCDNYSYEYSILKDKLSIPILKVETDYSEQCEGQMKTRIEAFIESLKKQHVSNNLYKTSTNNDLYSLGIDSGSTSTNAVILDSNYNIVAFSVVRTGPKSIESSILALNDVLSKGNLDKTQISTIISTGYGRVSIPFANKNITEISCHGKGAYYLNKNIRTIIDIGGQDSKIIKLDEKGNVIDFVMNDKCAAGTGRFLEMMAKSLETDISNMGLESLKSKESIIISNMCSVFAESEVISLIAQNKDKSDIINGLHVSIANKISSLLGRVGKTGEYMMTGGVAKNIGVVKCIEEKLGQSLFISDEPEIVGALGAAVFGMNELIGGETYVNL